MLNPLKSAFIWRWRKGFKTASKAYFDAAHGAEGDYSNYMPDAAFTPLVQSNGPLCRELLDNKLLFEKVVAPYAPVPSTLALIERDRVLAPTPSAPIQSLDTLLEYVRAHTVVLKPVRGMKGQGVHSLSWRDGPILDGASVHPSDLEALLCRLDFYMVVPWIAQADYAASVFPDAGNTLRIVTMRDPNDDGQAFIVAAVQKFGTRASVPTDNWARGALYAPVDIETGVMGSGLEDLVVNKGLPVWHELHPDTDARIDGLAVPRWPEVTAVLLELLEALPIFTYVGWDVLVTNEGFYIIEGNKAPVIVCLQLARPALSDPRVRKFAEHYGALRHVQGKEVKR